MDQQKKNRPSQRIARLPYLIMGMSDGLIVPLSLAAVFTSAGASVSSLVVICIAVSVFAAILTGIGAFKAVQENDFSEEAQREHADKNKRLLQSIGIPEYLQQDAAHDVEQESEEWQDILKNEAAPDGKRLIQPKYAGLTVALAYFFGGLIVVAPFLFAPFYMSVLQAFAVSASASFILLLILGYKKFQLAGMPGWQGSLILFTTGLLAASGAFAVARLFV